MANITLYYIDGISRENTPYFVDLDTQSAYMASHAIDTPTDGFYVPHYKDKIELSVTDLWFTRPFNYLSILFNSKVYYYFIDSIEYISEDAVSISISLDTIQTFMFEIDIHESIIERKFIDRMIRQGGQILGFNRNYIRENLSCGTWEKPVYNYVKVDTVGFIGALTNKTYTDSGSSLYGYLNLTTFYFQKDIVQDIGEKVYIPFMWDDVTGSELGYIRNYYTDNTQTPPPQSWEPYNQYTLLYKMFTSDKVENIFYIPFNPFANSSIEIVSGSTKGIKILGTMIESDSDIAGLRVLARPQELVTEGPMVECGVEFKRYTSIPWGINVVTTGVPYSSNNIVQMVDENYQAIRFGERAHNIDFPLYSMNGTYLYLKYTADIATGARYYGITDDIDDYTFSKGGIIEAPPIYLPKNTDAWKEYWAYNRANLAVAGINIATRLGGAVATHGVSALSGSIDKAVGKLSIELGKLYNVATQPDTVKQSSNHVADFISGACRQMYYYLKVIDFEEVAWYYHRYGYLVNRPFKSTYTGGSLDPFLWTLKNSEGRYYFDYYKFQYADIDLRYVCSADMINDVEQRLKDGIRVWYVDHGNICDYQYDNVERSVLS